MPIRYLSGVNVDSNTLVVDAANDRVGIGTASPANKLHVSGGDVLIDNSSDVALIFAKSGASKYEWYLDNASNNFGLYDRGNTSWRFFVTNSGNVGIGTTSPTAKLHVSGGDGIIRNAFIGEVPTYGVNYSQFSHTSRSGAAEYSFLSGNAGDTYVNSANGQPIYFRHNNDQNVVFTADGKVGIGTTSPGANLEIAKTTTWGTMTNEVIYINNVGTGGDINVPHNIGSITWRSGNVNTAAISAIRNTPASGNNVELRFTTASAGVQGERMIITAGGNVGIGTTSPARALNVSSNGTAGTQIQINGTQDSAGIKFVPATGDNWEVQANTNNQWFVYNRTDESYRFLIDGSGNVGVGTTDPAAKIQINGAAKITGGDWPTANAGLELNYNSNTSYIGSYDRTNSVYKGLFLFADNMTFETNASVRMYITSGGNVGIGTTNPASKLHVVGPINIERIGVANVYSTVDMEGNFRFNASDGYAHTFLNNGSELVRIMPSGNVGIGTTNPSSKLHIANLTLDNSAYQHLEYITANNSTEASGESYSGQASYGIGFRRQWSSSTFTNLAGIYAFGSGGWRGGLLFRTKNNTTSTGEPDIDALLLSPSGNVGIGTTAPAKLLSVRSLNNDVTTFAGFYALNETQGVELWYGGIQMAGSNSNVALSLSSKGAESIVFNTNSSEKMRITSAGNVGIGTTSIPNAVSGTETVLKISNSNIASLYFESTGAGEFANYLNSARSLVWYDLTAGAERMRITAAGNVGIGTTSPSSKLHISSTTTAITITDTTYNRTSSIGYLDSANLYFANDPASNTLIGAYNGVFLAYGGGSVGINTTNPAYKLDVIGSIRSYSGFTSNGYHGDTFIQNILPAGNNGASTGNVQLRMWCSEPGVTWDWAGFGYNVVNDGTAPYGFARLNSNFGQAYMRFSTVGDLYFYNTNTSNVRVNTAIFGNDGNVSFNGAGSFAGNVFMTQDANSLIFQQSNSSTHGIVWKNFAYTKESAAIKPTSLGAWATQGIGFYTGAAGDSTTAPSLRFDIQPGGNSIFYNNVGIGATDFSDFSFGSSILKIAGSRATLGLTSTGSLATIALISNSDSSKGIHLNQGSDGSFRWYQYSVGSETFSLAANGNLGIGTTAPAQKLDVSGNIRLGGGNSDQTLQIMYGSDSSGYGAVRFYQNNANHSTIHSFSNAWQSGTVFNASSGAINITGNTGVTFGDWNNIDAAISKSGAAYFKNNVGIGTTSPSWKLDVVGSARINGVGNNIATFFKSETPGTLVSFEDSSNSANDSVSIGSEGNNFLINVSYSERMRVTSAGNVGIGTTSPLQKLHVSAGHIVIENTYALYVNGSDYNWGFGRNIVTDSGFLSGNTLQAKVFNGTTQGFQVVNSSNTALFEVEGNTGRGRIIGGFAVGSITPSTTAGRIDASNDVVAYSTSDSRLKENITPIANALDKVKALTGVEFHWKEETKDVHGYEGHDVGVIAQEVQAVLPEAIRTNDSGYLSVRYEKMIALLIEGMKEQQNQIDELKAKLDGLTK
jgi:hypothetical protein